MADAEPERPPYMIVDGHSMIFAWEDLRTLHEQSSAAAREQLTHRLTTYQDTTGEHVVLVFDGRGDGTHADSDEDGIQIFYSPEGTTADQVIERLAGKYAQSRKLTIASRDRAVLDTCSAFGADAISANGLLDLLAEAERRLRERLS